MTSAALECLQDDVVKDNDKVVASELRVARSLLIRSTKITPFAAPSLTTSVLGCLQDGVVKAIDKMVAAAPTIYQGVANSNAHAYSY